MNRRRSLLCDVFQIDLHSQDKNTLELDGSNNDSSNTVTLESRSTNSDIADFTIDDDGYTILPPPLLNNNTSNSRFMRSHSLDVTSLNNSAASRGNVRRWSQSLSKGAKNAKRTVRQKTINFMPSRMQKALFIDGQMLTNHDSEIDQLTKEIEQHDHLMEDNATAEQLRIGTLRALPQSLTIKRQIKSKISRTVIDKSNSKNITQLNRLKYKLGKWIRKLWKYSRNTINRIELWYGSMKKIEGHFGSGVGTYFKFLRWLFGLDLMLMIMTLGFIVVPQILFNHFDGENQEIKTGYLQNKDNGTYYRGIPILDIFTGERSLNNSILFYGSYINSTFILIGNQTYNLPYAYFMTMVCLYMVTFIIVSVCMARSYRTSFIETSGGMKNMFAHKIFCSWDYSISNRKAAQLKHTTIYNELIECLQDIYDLPEKLSNLRKFSIIASQCTAHLIVFCMLGGLAFGMWTLLQIIGDNKMHSTLAPLYVSLTVNLTIGVFQIIFAIISKMEGYKSARLTLHITLLRNYLLEVVVVTVLLVFWLTNRKVDCWETSIGQEVYRLIIIDFLIFGIGGAMLHAIRFLIYRFAYENIGLPEFDISRGSLGLVFNQTLLWVGVFFSPPLAAIVTAKMVLIFYLKKTTLIYFCKPPSKLWRSAQTSTLFLVMIFLSLLGAVVAHGYIITQVEVSKICGPFRSQPFMFKIFIEGILELKEGNWFWRAIMFLTRPAVIGGVLLTMCVIVYQLRSKSKARIAMVKLLQDLLYLEAKDKEFLLANITRVTRDKDEWSFSGDDTTTFVKDNRRRATEIFKDCYAESSSTWDFRRENRNDTTTAAATTSIESELKSSNYLTESGQHELRRRF